MTNIQIAKLLRKVSASYVILDEKKYHFQIVAYERAADAIEHATAEVKDYWQEGKLSELTGVGKTMESHLSELFTTGKVKYFENLMRKLPENIFVLLDIPGIGPKTAFKLVTVLGLEKKKDVVAELEKSALKHKIRQIEGFGEKSEQDIQTSIGEYRLGLNKTDRMLLPYAYELSEKLVAYVKENKAVTQIYALGSLRRRVSTIGDIDLAVVSNKPSEVLDHFIKYPGTNRVIEKGKTTASIIVAENKEIDLMVQKKDGFGALLQHFTGSKNHNVHLREIAIKSGLSLSEYGIKQRGIIKKFAQEEDFYEFLGMSWIPPELREDMGEIESAIKHSLPTLVDVSDIKGDLQIHSNFNIEPSHDLGVSSMEEIVAKAKERGYDYIGFSEHNPSVGKHTLNEIISLIKRRNEEIEQIEESTKFTHIFKLLEVDILSSGDLAMDENALKELDGAIVSIHSNMNQSKSEMTARILRGLKSPYVRILAHPTGRLINKREGFDADWPKIFEFCAKSNKAIEINAFPERLDLPDVLVREAIQSGVKLIINTDSHAASHMDYMPYGVMVARRGWATKNDILNTLSYNEFRNWIHLRI